MGTMRLAVPLTDTELLAVSGDISIKLDKIEQVEREKKSALKDFNAEIESLEKSVHTLNQQFKSKAVYRDVDVDVVTDEVTGKRVTIRQDTGKIVSTEEMDPDEKQLSIGGRSLIDGAISKADAPTDEQIAAASPEEAERMRADRLAAEKADVAAEVRSQRLAALIAPLLEKIVVSGDATKVAKVDLVHNGKPFTCEGDGETAQEAIDVVREKLFDIYGPQVDAELAEIERLALEQATDVQKTPTLLKAPKGGKGKKKIKVVDKDDKPIQTGDAPDGDAPPPASDLLSEINATAAAAPGELCTPTCEINHTHTEERTAF
jgi:hypothetical protein